MPIIQKNLPQNNARKIAVFLSYSRKDGEFAKQLRAQLEELNLEVFLDENDIEGGRPWREEVRLAIERADAIVLLITPDWKASAECQREVDCAVKNGKRMVPILYRPTEGIDSRVVEFQFIPFVAAEPFKNWCQKIHRAASENLPWLRQHKLLQNQALRWSQVFRNRSLLLRGRELRAAEEWLILSKAIEQPPVTDLQRDFIKTCKRDHRLRSLIFAGLLVILLVAGASAFWQRREKLLFADREREQRSLNHVAEAYRILYIDPVAALHSAWIAHELRPSVQTRDAVTAAHRVARAHRTARRDAAPILGSGAPYLAGRWRQKGLHSKLSKDGKYILTITERSPDGATIPGDVNLLNVETLVTAKLKPTKSGRVEAAGFDRTSTEIFVIRHSTVEIFSLKGRQTGSVLPAVTKSPIHLIEGYLDGGYLIAADSVGAVWVFNPKSGQELRTEGEDLWGSRSNALISAQVSESGKFAVLAYENGSALLLIIQGPGEAVLRPLVESGFQWAAFHEGPGYATLLTTGQNGAVNLWKIHNSVLSPLASASHGTAMVGTAGFSADGSCFLTIGDDDTVKKWATNNAALLATITDAKDINWREALSFKTQTVDLPTAQPVKANRHVKMEQLLVTDVINTQSGTWLLTDNDKGEYGPAYRAEDEQLRPYPDEKHGVSEIRLHEGATWLLTSFEKKTGSACRVEKDAIMEFPARGISVYEMTNRPNETWFATSEGGYRLANGKLERIGPAEKPVRAIRHLNGDAWLLGYRGAYRMEGDRLFRTVDENIQVKDLRAVGKEIWAQAWLHRPQFDFPSFSRVEADRLEPVLPADAFSGIFGENDGVAILGTSTGAYRVQGNVASKISGCDKVVREIKTVGTETWLLTGDIINDGFGPAFRVEKDRAIPVPSVDTEVSDVVRVGGETWVLSWNRVWRVRGDTVDALPAKDANVDRVVELNGETWLLHSDTGGADRISADGTAATILRSNHVNSIKRIQDVTWLLTSEGAYRVTSGVATRAHSQPLSVRDIIDVDGTIWIAADKGIHRLPFNPADEAVRIGPAVSIKGLEHVGKRLWARGTENELYEVANGTDLKPPHLEIKKIVEVSGVVWGLTETNFTPGPMRRL